jgi:histidinol phosphatase-like enzyme
LGVSNQSGVSKDEISYEDCDNLFKYTNQLLGVDIDYRFCPHRSAPISCYCRKPQVGSFVEFFLKYKLNPSDCIVVGDLTSDRTFATRCGCKYIDQAEFFSH